MARCRLARRRSANDPAFQEMQVSGRRRRSNASLIKIRARAAYQTINIHNHIPNIAGPHSFAVLLCSVTWREQSHVNSATSMSARLVAIKRYEETALRAERRRRVERSGAQLFLTLA